MGFKANVYDGVKQQKECLEAVEGLRGGQSIKICFEGDCDTRSPRVLGVLEKISDTLTYGVQVRTERPFTTFDYDPINNRGHMPHDCYTLIGKRDGGTAHPQNVDRIIVRKLKD